MRQKRTIAIPVKNNELSEHFGLCDVFVFYELSENLVISEYQQVTPDRNEINTHEWLATKDIDVLISNGIGLKAISILENSGIEVIQGVSEKNLQTIIKLFIENKLEINQNPCDH